MIMGRTFGRISFILPTEKMAMQLNVSSALAEAGQTLAWNLLADKLDQTNASENFVLSPYSLLIAFSMALLGARGTTYDEMFKALAFPSYLAAAQNELIEAMQASQQSIDSSVSGCTENLLHKDQSLQLYTASKLYVQEDFGINPKYIAKVTQAFKTQVEQVDFVASPENVRKQINKFVDEATKNKIQDLLLPRALDELVRLVLISAVYMKTEWQEKFDEKQTDEEGQFYVAHEKRVQHDVPMMSLKTKFRYARNDVAQFVWLPYKGRQVHMVIAVPDARDGGLQAVQTAVTAAGGLHAMLKSLKVKDEVQLQLKMPRFKIETTIKLNEMMKRLGMSAAFDERLADFGDMVKNPELDKLYIGAAFQKVMIKVDEVGTEAAAATAVVVSLIRSVQHVKTVVADRPFLFWVEHAPTGWIMFNGIITAP